MKFFLFKNERTGDTFGVFQLSEEEDPTHLKGIEGQLDRGSVVGSIRVRDGLQELTLTPSDPSEFRRIDEEPCPGLGEEVLDLPFE